MFERFDDRARRTLVLAQEEARTLRSLDLRPEHILLGLLGESEAVEGRCVASQALSAVGVDYGPAREVVRESSPQGGEERSDPVSFSGGAKRVLERSLRVSLARGDATIGTEHLLLGLLEHEDDATAIVFAAVDTTKEEIEQQIEAILAERTVPANPVLPSRLPNALDLVTRPDPPARLDVLEGILWGIDHLDEVIGVLRGSRDRPAAREVLMAPPWALSHNQATGVLDLSVDSVTADRRQRIVEEVDMLRRQMFPREE